MALALELVRRVSAAVRAAVLTKVRAKLGFLSSSATQAWAGSFLGSLASSFSGSALLIAMGLAVVQAGVLIWLLSQPAAHAGPAAGSAWPAAYASLVQNHAAEQAQAAAPAGAKVSSRVGERPAQVALAPCAQVEAFSAPGAPLWGASRVGLRCKNAQQAWSQNGNPNWNIWVPVQVSVAVPALTANKALPAGSALPTDPQAWSQTQVDLATPTAGLNSEASGARAFNAQYRLERADPNLPIAQLQAVAGRKLARPLAAGQALRHGHLAAQQWFNTGATVQVVAQGDGFAVRTEAQALGPGLDGQAVRVRTESGRVLTGWAYASHAVQVQMQGLP